MKSVLHIIKQLCFVICFLLIAQLIVMGSIRQDAVKGDRDFEISSSMADTDFEESYAFNQMFGTSISDIITYAAGYKKNSNSKEPIYQSSLSANDLGYDYNEPDIDLRDYSEHYDKGNTNINFFLRTKTEKGFSYFDNINAGKQSIDDLKSSVLKNSSKYIFFDSEKNIFETNTEIEKSTLVELLNNYYDSFGDDIVFMAGLNSDLSKILDTYYVANQKYSLYTSNYWIKITAIIILAFVYLLLVLILTLKAGVKIDKETRKRYIRLNSFDKISVEIKILILLLLIVPYIILIDNRQDVLKMIIELYVTNINLCMLVTGSFILITGILISLFYYSFVRRVKARQIWKTSLLRILVLKLQKSFDSVKSKKGICFKAVSEICIIALINIILTAFAIGSEFYWIFIFLLVADILIGRVLYVRLKEQSEIISTVNDISSGNIKAKVDSSKMHGDNLKMANAINSIGDAVQIAVDKSMKDEKMKADLITNVSHDLKTPLTSIINYVDLLKKEKIDNQKVMDYIGILDEKSQRLKQLTDDLVEASKISSGNIVLTMEKINLKELLLQATGEFLDKFDEKKLSIVGNGPENAVYINADSRRIYRVIENLFTNIYKYALPGTRVFVDIIKDNGKVYINLKNTSEQPLNISPEELTERFIRGDESRNTEGSGLGLSIAKNLTEAMGGNFVVNVDGDLFKVIVGFDELS